MTDVEPSTSSRRWGAFSKVRTPRGQARETSAGQSEGGPPCADEQQPAVKFQARLREKIGSSVTLAMAEGGFSLIAGEDRVAFFRYGDWHNSLIEIACAEERWELTRHTRVRRDLILRRTHDHTTIGRYRGKHWRAGGTIELPNNVTVLVSKPLSLRWRLKMEGAKPFADISHSHLRLRRLRVNLKSLPSTPESLHLAVLTVCGVILIEDVLAQAAGGGG